MSNLSYCVTTSLKRLKVVQEFQPVSHHLRLSASAKGPTYPERISLAQETLDFWRTGFSPVYSLLMPACSLLYRPAVLSVYLQPI